MSRDNEVTTKLGTTVEVQSILMLSTGHVTKATADILNTPGQDLIGGVMIWQSYGWVVWVDADAAVTYAQYPDLVACMKFALDMGIFWIRFDCDVDAIPDLPSYDW